MSKQIIMKYLQELLVQVEARVLTQDSVELNYTVCAIEQ